MKYPYWEKVPEEAEEELCGMVEFNRWQRKAIAYFIAVMRSWSPEERRAAFRLLKSEFGEW